MKPYFFQSLHEKSLKTNKNIFLPHPFLFIIHQSPQNVTLCNMRYSEVSQSTREIGKITKKNLKNYDYVILIVSSNNDRFYLNFA